jgi:hypothetical protein
MKLQTCELELRRVAFFLPTFTIDRWQGLVTAAIAFATLYSVTLEEGG